MHLSKVSARLSLDTTWTLPTKKNEARHVALVQKLYEAISQGDVAKLRALLAETLEAELVGPHDAFSGKASGIDAFLSMLQENFGQVEQQAPEIIEVVSQGSLVTVLGKETGRLRSEQNEYRLQWIQFYRYEDDKLVEFRQVSQFE